MSTFDVRLHAVRLEAEGVHSFELRALPGQALPPFTAGAHIDLHLPNGMVRSYSLSNPPAETQRYVLGVHRSPTSRGGSALVHAQLHVGQTLRVGMPRNNFPLFEAAPHTVLIAGGIGITPLRSMIGRLEALGRSWELFYGCRRRACAAWHDELLALDALAPGRVHFSFDGEHGESGEHSEQRLDLRRIVADARGDAHLYCCGPRPMLEAFEAATAGLPRERVHVEYFSAKEAPASEGGFRVELARSGRTVCVAPGQTILDTLLAAGVDAPYACMEGVCGSCETRVLAGTPDHRDLVLSGEEQRANDRMMICCSGAKSATLVLDL
ncbi:2Fe-2S iron-sulfur cluster-binding protein [Variovorax sp. RCC_210]|uniref:PDR/VanB family oxidoreductase n=1 Tax=Variovorax sp. RCC_210 TaxID=3239217 RepID=UPI00352375D8